MNPVPPLRVEPVEVARVPPVIEEETPAKAALPTAGTSQLPSSSHVAMFTLLLKCFASYIHGSVC